MSEQDRFLFEMLKPGNKPADDINNEILRKYQRRVRKRKIIKQAAVAAVFLIVVTLMGAVGYAAVNDISIMSLFDGEGKKVREKASKLIEKNVKQESENESELVKFKVKEALCDGSRIVVKIDATPVNSDKYMVVPANDNENFVMENLGIKGSDGKLTVKKYAEKYNKKYIETVIGIRGERFITGEKSYLKNDGTLSFIIRYDNRKKAKKINYICDTAIYTNENMSYSDAIKSQIKFQIKNATQKTKSVYKPESADGVKGTDIVVDKVVVIKSELELLCKVYYHQKNDSEKKTDIDNICFNLLDKNGDIIQSGDGGNIETDSGEFIQKWYYTAMDLNEKIKFAVNGISDKKVYDVISCVRKR